MLILNRFIYPKIYEKEKKNLQKIIVIQMYEIKKIQMHFQSNYLNFKKICACVYIYTFWKSL